MDQLGQRIPPLEQRRIGLTGGIATGKSTVARLLAERFGLPVLDADQYARDALAPGSAGARAVLEHFGDRVGGEGAIDRGALGRIVFADAGERHWLERLVHPLVRARFDTELARLRDAPVVVLMIPLLFEAGLQALCSEVWLVACPAAEQLRRLQQRDGFSASEARARLEAQWPLARKLPLADVVIDNGLHTGGDHQGLERQLAERLARC